MIVLMISHLKTIFFTALLVLVGQPTWAQSRVNQGFVFEGSLTDNSGNAISLEGQQLYYYISAFDGSSKCIIYAESSTTSGNSLGTILHTFGTGSPVTSPVSYNHTLLNSVFSGAVSGKLNSSTATCTVAADAKRYVDVYSDVLAISASVELGATPYSKYADNSRLLNGRSDTEFVLSSSLSGGTDGQVLSRSSAGFAWINIPSISGSGGVDVNSSGGSISVSLNLTASHVASALGYTPASSASVAALTTGAVSETTNLYYTDTRVKNVTLSAFSPGANSPVSSTDSIFQSIAKLQGQINARWQSSSSNIYFESGNVSIGSSSSPGQKLYIKQTGTYTGMGNPAINLENWEDGGLSTAATAIQISRRSPSGVGASNGFGTGISFNADDSAKTLRNLSTIKSFWVNADTASNYSAIAITTKNSDGTVTTKIHADQTGVSISNSNLSVSGSIRLSGDGSNNTNVCSTSDEGKQRYNSLHKAMEFCDGSRWRGITGVTYCESGFSLVGKPGTQSAFCIDTNALPSSDVLDANSVCVGRNTGNNSKAKICNTVQMDLACENFTAINPSLNNFNNNISHWTSNANVTLGASEQPSNLTIAYDSANASSCHIQSTTGTVPHDGRILTASPINNTNNYRCCYE